MEKKEKETNSFDVSQFVKFVASNWYAYVMFALALLVCFYTIYNVEDYQQKVNNKWMIFISDHCSCSAYYKPEEIGNVSFKLQSPADMVSNYGKSNYNRSVYFVGGQATTEEEYLYDGIGDGLEWN